MPHVSHQLPLRLRPRRRGQESGENLKDCCLKREHCRYVHLGCEYEGHRGKDLEAHQGDMSLHFEMVAHLYMNLHLRFDVFYHSTRALILELQNQYLILKTSLDDNTKQLRRLQCSKKKTVQAPEYNLWDEYLVINETLGKIEELEKTIVIPPRKREDHFEDFMTWVTSYHEQPTKTSIQLFDGEWGLRAENDIKKGELWMTIPRKLMMTLQTALQSPLGELIKTDPILSNMPQVALTLHLLHETFNPGSFWEPYIKILPLEYNTVLYFSPQELALLKGSPVYDESLKHVRHISRQYAYFWRLFQKTTFPQLQVLTSQFTFAAYRWAVSTVMTRQNAVPAPEEATPTCPALVPLWDMCNHGRGEISTDYSLQMERLECYAMRHVHAGQQMLIHYGDRTSAQLFVHNGFVDEKDEEASVSVRLGVSKNDPLFVEKQTLLGKLQLENQQVFQISAKGQLDPELLAFTRVFCMTSDELKEKLAQSEVADLKTRALSGEDSKVKQFLIVRIKLLLGGQKDKDTELDTPRAKMAMCLRSLEERTLKMALDHLQSN